MDLQPFRAYIYDEPGSSDGVVDVTNLVGTNELDLSPDRLSRPDAATVWAEWMSGGFLRQVPDGGIYLLRSGRMGDAGSLQASGFLARDASVAADTPAHRIHRDNLDPELAELLTPTGVPLARATSPDGTHHRVWQITATAVVETLCSAGASLSSGAGPLVLLSTGDIDPPEGLLFLA